MKFDFLFKLLKRENKSGTYLGAGEELLGFGASPEKDWKILFFMFLTLTLAAVVISVFIFLRVDKKEVFDVRKSEISKGKSLDEKLLVETVKYYQEKESNFLRLTGGN